MAPRSSRSGLTGADGTGAAPAEDAERGRGPLPIGALPRRWGVSSLTVGKTVWAGFALPRR